MCVCVCVCVYVCVCVCVCVSVSACVTFHVLQCCEIYHNMFNCFFQAFLPSRIKDPHHFLYTLKHNNKKPFLLCFTDVFLAFYK